MAHGITINMRAIKPPRPDVFVAIEYQYDAKGRRFRVTAPADAATYVNPDKDRTLAGKARRRARRAVSA